MKMTVKKSSIGYFCLLMCLALDVGLYQLPGIRFFYFGYITLIQAFLCVALAVWCFTDRRCHHIIVQYCKRINIVVLVYLSALLFQVGYTNANTSLDFNEIIINLLPYAKVLLVYPVIYLIHTMGVRKIENGVIAITIIYLVYTVFLVSVYSIWGINLDSVFLQNEAGQRFGLIRLRSISLTWFTCILLFKRWLVENERKNLIWAILVLLYVIFINQGRAAYIALTITLISMYFFKKRHTGRQLFVFLLLCVVCAVFVNSGILERFVATLLPSYTGSFTGNTTLTRLDQLALFNSMLKEMPLGIWAGLGLRNFVPAVNSVGNMVNYYFLDTGIIGDVINLGVFAIFLFLVTEGGLFRLAMESRKKKGEPFYFAIGAFTFVLVGCIGYTIFPYARIIALPFVWGFQAYYRRRLKDGQDTTEAGQ